MFTIRETYILLISVMLWMGCFVTLLWIATQYRVDPFTWLDCKFFTFLTSFSTELSSWLLVVMCIEKFFALYFPLKTRSICTVAMAKRVTFVVTFILAIYNSQAFFIFKVFVSPADGYKYCHLVNISKHYAFLYQKIEGVLYSLAPFTIMVLTNGAIIYKFMRASCARDQGGTESTNQALSKSANKGTAMLITVSVAFLLLTGPVAVSSIVALRFDPIQQLVVTTMRYINHSINAVLYCTSGSRFRNELLKTFPFNLCAKETNLRSGSQSVSSLTGNSTSATVTTNVTASPNN